MDRPLRRMSQSLSEGFFQNMDLRITDGRSTGNDSEESMEGSSRYYNHHHLQNGRHRHNPFHLGSTTTSLNTNTPICQCPTYDDLNETKLVGFRLVKSGLDLVKHSISVGEHQHISTTESHSNCGHVMADATSTRYWGRCETCRRTVHGSKYLYCKNCLVVVHNYRCCWKGLRRHCPAPELGVYGWGEGTAKPTKNLQKLIDLDQVYLCSSAIHQPNGCADCGRILYSGMGHPCEKPQETDEAQDRDRHPHTYRLRALVTNGIPIHRGRPEANNMCRNGVGEVKDGGTGALEERQVAKKVLPCHLTGKLYCENCHWGDKWYMPGHIFVLNDLEKHPVSRNAYLKLRIMWDTALFKVPSYWLKECKEAAKVHLIRKQFHRMERYTYNCDEMRYIKEIVSMPNAPHLLEDYHYILLADARLILNNSILPILMEKFEFMNHHIQSCRICHSKPIPLCSCKEAETFFFHGNSICSKCKKPRIIDTDIEAPNPTTAQPVVQMNLKM